MYDEQFMQYKAEASFKECQKDPKAWTEKVEKTTREMWFGLTILYVGLVAILLITSFPSTSEINLWLQNQRVQFWLPFACAAVGLALYLLKLHLLLVFGATEIAFSFASAYLFKSHIIVEGIASWAAGVAVVYLFAKGFENCHKGLKELIAVRTMPPNTTIEVSRGAA